MQAIKHATRHTADLLRGARARLMATVGLINHSTQYGAFPMPRFKDLVCLANSRKRHGRCVAGKEVNSSGFGKWVRPISSAETGELSLQAMAYQKGQIPQLLDIIRIPVKEHSTHGYQTKNYLIDETAHWQYKGKVDIVGLPDLCDSVDTLWINGFHSFNGFNIVDPTI